MYGFQWMHFGAEYKDMHTDYTGQGVHQLADCIDKVINNLDDRRIVMSAWTPSKGFGYDGTSQMYERPEDIGLGVPFNIVLCCSSYARNYLNPKLE